MSLRLARVTATHPEDHSVDLVMIDDGSRHVAAQVVAMGASTNTGVFGLPTPTGMGDKWSMSERTDRDSLAVVSMMAGSNVPIVLGFLFPQVNGVLFADPNRYVNRHASDVYTTVNGQGDVEVAHPSGTYIRIGASPDHENLTGQDFDGNWAIKKNTGAAPHLCVTVCNAGTQKAKLHIDPTGNITLEHAGNLVVNTTGTAHMTTGGAATLTAPSVTIESPTSHITGTLTVDGLLTYKGGLTGSGGSGASLTGNLAVTGNVSNTGTLTSGGKNVGSTHTHSGVQTGSGTSGAPT